MGTNYYWRHKLCDCCGRYEETHIGKSSFGWSFIFHGLDEVSSYRDWLSKLGTGGKIFDEYNREVSLEDFKKLVEGKRGGKSHSEIDDLRSWVDGEGYSFSPGEFS